MNKDDIISALREMADLLEITDANKFEIMALRNGAQGLEDWAGDLDQAVSNSSLTEIPSVGKGISQVITDLARKGQSEELDRVRGLVPKELPLLLKFRGLGPKRVRALWKELDIESPADLKRAIDEQRVQSLKGFGPKMIEKMLSSLEYFENIAAKQAWAPPATRYEIPTAPSSTGRIWAGISGYSYPQWKGNFYPRDANTDDLLQHYATQLSTVEINNTFYRFPSQKVIDAWKSQTSDDFHFSLKAHRRITHQLRLNPQAPARIIEFVERCGELESRLGCILFQLPPDFSRNDARLETLTSSLPQGPRYAIEFRHDSWINEDVLKTLREKNIACVCGDADNEEPQQWVTADFVYARLRRGHYTDDELRAWDDWFQTQLAEKRDVLVYVKHDDEGAVPSEVIARWKA